MAAPDKKRIKPNIFTMLVIVAAFAFAFRLVNVLTFSTKPAAEVGMVKMAEAEAQKPAHTPADGEEPPPLTQDDVRKAVESTSREVEDTLPPAPMVRGLDGEIKQTDANQAEENQSNAPPPDDLNRSFSTAEIEVLQSLSKRRDEIDARARNLDEREALLKAGEQEVDRKIAELNKMKSEIEQLLGTQEKMEDDRIGSLVKIYENMKPKEAATIFNTLDMDVLLSVVSRMNERKLSPVLASMDPEKARLVTIRLAEQRKLPGKQAVKPDEAPASGNSNDSGGDAPVLNLPESSPPTP